MTDGINIIQDCFRDSFDLRNLEIDFDNQRSFDITISPKPQSDVSPMLTQDNLEFLIRRGFRIANMWSECTKGLRMTLIQVYKS